MKKLMLAVLTALFTINLGFVTPPVKAVESTAEEVKLLGVLNDQMGESVFVNFVPEEKTYLLLPVSQVADQLLADQMDEAQKNNYLQLRKVMVTFSELLKSELGQGYTLKMLGDVDGQSIIFHIKDGTLVKELSKESNMPSAIDEILGSQTEAKPSREQELSLQVAQQYIDYMPFSKESLYQQLVKDRLPEELAKYAVENVEVDWREQALLKAKSYLEMMPLSEQALYSQLLSEGFTEEEATAAVKAGK